MSKAAPQPMSARANGFALAAIALLAVVVALRLQPPRVRPVTLALTEFSAARAREVVGRLLSEAGPHAAGTAAGARMVTRLRAEIEGLGLVPEVQSGVACSKDGVCAELHNVVSRVPGREPGFEVVLAAHHDSVPVGPGAGDDVQGVATLLEIARALSVEPPRRGVVLLFTDGEELGMLGAKLFADEHPLASEVKVVLNLEARGNRGPSLMFETTPGSAWLVERFARSPRPVSSSLFGAVYRTLPNDTDLTVFAAHGWQGLNFAFVGGVENYHTPLDTLERLDLRSVQQQGDSALATTVALLEGGVETPGAEAIYFDVLATFLLRAPAPLVLPLLPLPLLVFAYFAWRTLRSAGGRALLRASLFLPLVLLLPALAAVLLGSVLGLLGALPFPVVAQPGALLLALIGLVFAAQLLVSRLLDTHTDPLAAWTALFGGWALIGLGIAIVMPPASYIVMLPALVAAIARLCMTRHEHGRLAFGGMLLSAACAALLWLPPLFLLPATIGVSSPAALALPLAFGLSPLAPFTAALLGKGRAWLPIALGSLAMGLAQCFWAPYSEDVPRRLTLLFETDPAGTSRWLADAGKGPLPEALRAKAAWSPRALHPHPWPTYGQHSTYSAPAEERHATPPLVRWTRNAAHSAKLVLDAPEDIWAIGVRFAVEAGVASASWRGRTAFVGRDARGPRLLLVPGQERRVELELTFEGAPPVTLPLLTIELGLPEHARALHAARAPEAVSSGFGDLTVTHLEARALD